MESMKDSKDAALRQAFLEVQTCITTALNGAIARQPLNLSSNHPIGHKTVSEVGGRFIEDYLTSILESVFKSDKRYGFLSTTSRSLGDFVVAEREPNSHRFYFDVKAQHLSIRERTYEFYKEKKIDAKKPGEGHPNLISYEKAKDFFSDSSRTREDIAFVMIHYDPEIVGGKVNFNLKPLAQHSIFLLRDIGDDNLSFGNLGKGQVQLKRVSKIGVKRRGKKEFVDFISALASKPRATRAISRD